MIQTYPRSFFGLGYSATTQTAGVTDGSGSLTVAKGPPPMIFSGVARNLTIYAADALDIDVRVDVMLNGVATGVTATLLAGVIGRQAFDSVNSFSYSAGDYLFYKFTNSNIEPAPGLSFACSLECEQSQQVYGCCSAGGTIPVGPAFTGGALGNGAFTNWGGDPTDVSATYSIAGIDGVIDHLALIRFTAQSGGGWKAYLTVDGVLQDGSGGTVDTLLDLADSDPAYKVVTFSGVTVTIGHIYAIVVYRYGTTASFGGQVAASVAVTPTIPGAFMLSGGNNDTIADTGTTWKWNTSVQNGTIVEEHTAPIGQTGITITGLFVQRSVAAGSGSVVYTITDNNTPTTVTATQTGSATSAVITGQLVPFAAGDLITLQLDNVNFPTTIGARLHWGLGMIVTGSLPTGAIVVDKVAPENRIKEFPFVAGGGLSPTDFSLRDGESQGFGGIAAGDGYSIDETVPDGWIVSYEVSNDSPHDDISVDSGETVTVTVTNILICPGDAPEPRTDGLPYNPTEPPPCPGDGMVTAPRTGT